MIWNSSAGRPRLVGLANIKNEAWIIERWLERTSKIVDCIIVVDGGSTDGTVEILERHPAVHEIIRIPKGHDDRELLNLNRLLAAVRPLNPEWVLLLDADEIMDARLPGMLDDLLSRPGVGRYLFREITLWRSNQYYRVDKPERYMRIHSGFPSLLRYTPALKWVYPVSLKGYVYLLLTQRLWPPRFPLGHRELVGIAGSTVELGDVVKIHYHYADWDRAWCRRTRYAVWQAINYRKPMSELDDIVAWATRSLDEEGLKLAPVKPEWGVL